MFPPKTMANDTSIQRLTRMTKIPIFFAEPNIVGKLALDIVVRVSRRAVFVSVWVDVSVVKAGEEVVC